MNFQIPDLTPMMPELLMTALALTVLLLDLVIKKKEIVALISMAGVALVTLSLFGPKGETFGSMFISDGYSTFFKLIFFVNVILSVLISIKYIAVERVNYGEYYSPDSLLDDRHDDHGVCRRPYRALSRPRTHGAEYVCPRRLYQTRCEIKRGSIEIFPSGRFFIGIPALRHFDNLWTYGHDGSEGDSAFINERGLSDNFSLLLSVIFLTVAFGFKIAAAPFHMWAPDVYEGAPTSITAFMSVGPKAAGFAVLGRVFMVAFVSVKVEWAAILIPLSILTMAVGNIVALSQTNIKRMLAYSSIAHAGYALLGIITANNEGLASIMNYLMIYAFMNIGAFAVIIMLRSEGFKGESIYDYQGLSKTHPLAAVLMLIFMFSLTGIPPTAGFIGKLYIFMSAINAGYTWLVIIAVIFSAISAYFYLRIVMYMYMREPKETVTLTTSFSNGVALGITTFAVLFIGVLPSFLLNLAKAAIQGF